MLVDCCQLSAWLSEVVERKKKGNGLARWEWKQKNRTPAQVEKDWLICAPLIEQTRKMCADRHIAKKYKPEVHYDCVGEGGEVQKKTSRMSPQEMCGRRKELVEVDGRVKHTKFFNAKIRWPKKD